MDEKPRRSRLGHLHQSRHQGAGLFGRQKIEQFNLYGRLLFSDHRENRLAQLGIFRLRKDPGTEEGSLTLLIP